MVKILETRTEGSEKHRKLNPMVYQVMKRSRRTSTKRRPLCLDIKRLTNYGCDVLVI